MKTSRFLLLLIFFVSAISFGQEKKYISYEIQKGETLKSIAKTYNMSTRSLAKLNPGVKRKPVAGTVIIVPNKNYGKATTIVKNEGKPKGYIVKPKETKFGISKKFGISIEELEAANPALADGLKIGMELNIPKPTVAIAKDTVNYVVHKVIKDDTLFSLTRKYNVTEEELFLLNPNLKDGLKLGMLLKMKPIDPSTIKEINEEEKVDSIMLFEEKFDLGKEINVAVILPYQLNKLNDSLVETSFKKQNSLLNIATDFHLGTEVAIDSLRKKGLKINVSYFDSENSTQKLQMLLSRNQNFNNKDVVIGPLFLEKSHWVSKKTKAPVIAPLYSKKQATLKSANLVKTAPNKKAHQELLLEHLEVTYKGENVLVINDGKQESQSPLWQIVNKLKSFDSIQTISVIKPEEGYIHRDKFFHKLDSTTKNWVILISDENVTTSTTVNNLKGFAERIDIKLFSLNKGKNFNNIDNNILGKLGFLYPSATYIDPKNPLVDYFYKAYRRKNRALPSKYGIRGFDVTYDAIARIASSNSNDLTLGKSYRVSAIFDYKKPLFQSTENNGLFLIEYAEDLTPTILK